MNLKLFKHQRSTYLITVSFLVFTSKFFFLSPFILTAQLYYMGKEVSWLERTSIYRVQASRGFQGRHLGWE